MSQSVHTVEYICTYRCFIYNQTYPSPPKKRVHFYRLIDTSSNQTYPSTPPKKGPLIDFKMPSTSNFPPTFFHPSISSPSTKAQGAKLGRSRRASHLWHSAKGQAIGAHCRKEDTAAVVPHWRFAPMPISPRNQALYKVQLRDNGGK